jgi:hypothetical protein
VSVAAADRTRQEFDETRPRLVGGLMVALAQRRLVKRPPASFPKFSPFGGRDRACFLSELEEVPQP